MLRAHDIYRFARLAGFSPDQATTMTAIALAESGGKSDALNPRGEMSRGLWQINGAAHAGFNNDALFDPLENAKAAYRVSRGGSDVSPWTTTHNRPSAKYLSYRTEAEAAARANGESSGLGNWSGTSGYGNPLSAGSGGGPAYDAAGAGFTGGTANDAFVQAALNQTGDRYVFGAETALENPDPTVFDCCLTGETIVHTANRGPVQLVEVAPGDSVWCWDDGSLGQRKVVTVAEQPVQSVYAVRTHGRQVRASANHPFLVLRRTSAVWRTEWVRVDALTRGDLVVAIDRLPGGVEPVALPDGTPVTGDRARVLGRSLGDARDGRVPELLRRLRPRELRALLAGYAETAGHRDRSGHQRYASSSRALVADVRALHLALGDRVSTITTTGSLHAFTVRPDDDHRSRPQLDDHDVRRALPDRTFTVEPICSIEPDGVEPTFDLEIEGARCYLADGLVVHNSELTQWAGHQAGVELPDGAMYQYLSLKDKGATISVEEALRTKGALLFNFSTEPTPGGGRPSSAHVAISLGDGRTIEARGTQYGVGSFSADTKRFNYAAVVPGLAGSASGPALDGLAPAVIAAPQDFGPSIDTDQDGLIDGREVALGTDIHATDTDKDGASDGYELARMKTDPTKADTDSDGLGDSMELAMGSDPNDPDSDRDGRLDGSDTSADSDSDGLSDALERLLGSDPFVIDSDADGFTDALEYQSYLDPVDPMSNPLAGPAAVPGASLPGASPPSSGLPTASPSGPASVGSPFAGPLDGAGQELGDLGAG